MLCSTLRLQGGLTDQHITKIVQLAKSKELKELSIAKNNITDEGAPSIAQFIFKARGLHSFDLSNNFIGNQGISLIAQEGLGENKRL